MQSKQIDFINGLKFLLCCWIAAFHFFLSYKPDGFIGFYSGVAQADKFSVIRENFPLSWANNTNIQLYLFFFLISFVASVLFFKKEEPYYFLKKQAVKRYFRFLIPCSLVMAANVVFCKTGLLKIDGIFSLSSSPWVYCLVPPKDQSFFWYVKNIFVLVYFRFAADTSIYAPLWCLPVMFLGSYFTYGFLAVFGKSQKRFFAYAAALVISMLFPYYFIFVCGIILADFYVHSIEGKALYGMKFNLAGTALVIAGFASGFVPEAFYAEYIPGPVVGGAASFLVVLGLSVSSVLQKFLGMKFFVRGSKYSFCIYLMHIFVLVLFSYSPMKYLIPAAGYDTAFFITLVLYLVFSYLLSVVFYYAVEKPSGILSEKISGFFA